MQNHDSVLINNQWKEGSGALFTSYNPATGESLWEGRESSKEDVEEAVKAAAIAFDRWAALSLDKRFDYLSTFAHLLQKSRHHFAICISKETGKPLWESLSEVDSMVNKARISLDAFHQRCPEIVRELPQTHSITRHRPHGVLAILGPYNFPGHLPNGHIMPALLAGNTIVFKPSELTPLVAEEMLNLWRQAGLPDGVLNLVQGGRTTGEFLIQEEGINGLLFTGSYQTGQALAKSMASQTSKILALEMGGNNPLVVGQIEHIQAAAYLALHSAYLSSGQRCTCARRLILPRSKKADQLVDLLVEMIGGIAIGPYTQAPEPFLGPVISEKHAAAIYEEQDHLRSKGGKVLAEMRLMKEGTGFITPGLMEVTSIKDLPDNEIFGPFLQVIRTDNFEEAVHAANQTKFGLSAGLLSDKEDEYDYFYRHIRAGIVNWNTSLVGASSAAPFGGVKASGNFRPSAFYAADYSAYPVASCENRSLDLPSSLPPGINLKNHKEC